MSCGPEGMSSSPPDLAGVGSCAGSSLGPLSSNEEVRGLGLVLSADISSLTRAASAEAAEGFHPPVSPAGPLEAPEAAIPPPSPPPPKATGASARTVRETPPTLIEVSTGKLTTVPTAEVAAGQGASLRAVLPDESSFLFFLSFDVDQVDGTIGGTSPRVLPGFLSGPQDVTVRACFTCHSQPGLESINTLTFNEHSTPLALLVPSAPGYLQGVSRTALVRR